MNEDQCCIRGDGAENFAVVRHIALNQLHRENSTKKSLRLKQRKAARNDDYLEKVFFVLSFFLRDCPRGETGVDEAHSESCSQLPRILLFLIDNFPLHDCLGNNVRMRTID